jgi:hypothetical protein
LGCLNCNTDTGSRQYGKNSHPLQERQDAEHQANLKRKVMPDRQRTAKCAGSPLQTLTARSPTPTCAHLVTAGSNAVGTPPPEAVTRRRPRPQQTQPRPPQTTGRHCIVLRPLMHHTGQRAPFHAGHQIRPGPPGSKASRGEGPCDALGFLFNSNSRSTQLTVVKSRSTWALTSKNSLTYPSEPFWLVDTLVGPTHGQNPFVPLVFIEVCRNFCRVLQNSPKHLKFYLYESCPF